MAILKKYSSIIEVIKDHNIGAKFVSKPIVTTMEYVAERKMPQYENI